MPILEKTAASLEFAKLAVSLYRLEKRMESSVFRIPSLERGLHDYA